MIRARGEHSDGREFVVLGLTEKNLELLRAGKPIVVKPEDFERGPAWPEILSMYGQTEVAIVEELGLLGVIGEDVVVHRERNMGDEKDHRPRAREAVDG
jgi:hypothetical protein